MNTRGTVLGAALAVFLAGADLRVGPSVAFAQQAPQIRVLPVRGNIYVLQGAGANITVSVEGRRAHG